MHKKLERLIKRNWCRLHECKSISVIHTYPRFSGPKRVLLNLKVVQRNYEKETPLAKDIYDSSKYSSEHVSISTYCGPFIGTSKENEIIKQGSVGNIVLS